MNTRKHSSRMRTPRLPPVRVLVAATRCQYQWGQGGYLRSHVQDVEAVGTHPLDIPIPLPSGISTPQTYPQTPPLPIGISTPGHTHPPPDIPTLLAIPAPWDTRSPYEQTHTCENITFSLLLRAVKIAL